MANRKKIKIAALICLPLFCLIFLDKMVIASVAQNDHTYWRDFGSRFTDIASAVIWIPAAVALIVISYFFVYFSRDRDGKILFVNLRNWATHFILALLGTSLVTHLVKLCFGRERPVFATVAVDAWNFNPFRGGYLYSSFPSGHSQVIFCVASFLAMLFPRFRFPCLAFALAVALTRVLVLKHFPSDVTAGMLLGFYGSQFSVRVWSRKVPVPKPLLV